MNQKIVSLVLLALCVPSLAYQDGAQVESCYTHEINHTQPVTTFRYDLCADSCFYRLEVKLVLNIFDINNVIVNDTLVTEYECGQIYQVSIKQVGNNAFRGFLVQARDDTVEFTSSSTIYGTWLEHPNLLYKPLNCSRNESMADSGSSFPNSATHKGAITPTEGNQVVPLYWMPPTVMDDQRPVAFWYSIVEQREINYFPVKGPVLMPSCSDDAEQVITPNTPTTDSPETTVVMTTIDVITECPAENDPIWWLPFPPTLAGSVATRSCPQNGTSVIIGFATRLCEGDGDWSSVDTSNCTREDFANINSEATEVFSNNYSAINPVQVQRIISDLVVATDTVSTGGSTNFATDLNTTNSILNQTLTYLLDDSTSSDSLRDYSEEVLNVMNNVLDDANEMGWQELQQDTVGSQQLLQNAENYGQHVAAILESNNNQIGNNTKITLTRDNIVVHAEIISANQRVISDILFPVEVDDTTELGTAQTLIPAELLKERGAGDENMTVNVVNIEFSNLEMFLPKERLQKDVTRPATPVISSQVLSDIPDSKFGTEAIFKFKTQPFSDDKIVENPRCVSWNFSRGIVESSWSTDGVETVKVVQDPDTGEFKLECHSTHLTAFAVLVDVTGSLNTTSEEVRLALSVVTYVGCAISLFCLILTIIYLISLRKELIEKIHNFIHLNLAISLFLGYLLFVALIEPAVGNRGLCVFVAAMLHYLFTAAFCWMLCEGIMLYLLLVTVFGWSKIKKWWFFFIIGWGLPIIPVAISVGVLHDQYGNDKYCWISVGDVSRGALWAFVVPMMAVILVNLFFLTAALWSVFKQRKSKLKGDNYKKNIILFEQLIKATIILLPLLGLTWVFGLLTAVGGEFALAFAWIFTILNTLQGFFIFIFHVLRSEKVSKKLSAMCKRKRKKDTTSSDSLRNRLHSESTSVTNADSLNSSGSHGLANKKLSRNYKPTLDSSIQEESLIDSSMQEEGM